MQIVLGCLLINLFWYAIRFSRITSKEDKHTSGHMPRSVYRFIDHWVAPIVGSKIFKTTITLLYVVLALLLTISVFKEFGVVTAGLCVISFALGAVIGFYG